MNKTAAAFVVGAFAAAASLLYSGLNGPAAAFACGFVVNLIAIAGVLSNRRRIRSTADFLNRVAGKAPKRQERTTAAPQPAAIESDVAAALVQLGAPQAAAKAAAAKAFAAAPAAGFDSIFRSALQLTKA